MQFEKLRQFFLKQKRQIAIIGIFLGLAGVVLAANSFSNGGLLKGVFSTGPVITQTPVMSCQYTAGAKPSIAWTWQIPQSSTSKFGTYYAPVGYTFSDAPNGANTLASSPTQSTKTAAGTEFVTRYYPAGTTQVNASIDVSACVDPYSPDPVTANCTIFPAVVTKTCTAPIVSKPTTITAVLDLNGNNTVFTNDVFHVVATVNITGGSANEYPNGTVNIKEGNNVVGSGTFTNNSNKTTALVSLATPGAHSLTASYVGTSKYKASGPTSPLQVTVIPKTTIVLTANPGSGLAKAGDQITFTADVQDENGDPASGSVTFREGQTILSPLTAMNGIIDFKTSILGAGSHNITVAYNIGGGLPEIKKTISNYVVLPNLSNGPGQKTASTITLTSSAPNGANEGIQITFNGVLSTLQATPTGNVVITDGVGGQVLFSKNLTQADNGTISFSTSALTKGVHSIVMTYDGDALNLPAEKSIIQTVTDPLLAPPVLANPTVSCTATPANPKIGETVTWSASVGGVADPTQISFEWSGDFEKAGTFNASGKMSDTVKYNSAGKKSAEITVFNEPSSSTKNCSVNVIDPGTPKSAQKTQTPDILSCKNYGSKTLALSANEQIYSSCTLSQAALVSAFIMNDSYKSGDEIKPEQIVRSIMEKQSYQPQNFSVGWTGVDDFDSTVDLGKYKIVVGAQYPGDSIPDYSVLDIEVIQDPLIVPKTETNTQNQPSKITTTPKINDNFNLAKFPPVKETLHAAAKEMSKCPGVFYPTDIETHWGRNYIRYAIDRCIIRGYDDGTFKPDAIITRAQAVKIVLGAAGIQPETSCSNSSCGTGFKDLQAWQGSWIRAGQKYGLINGKGNTLFRPEDPITREQYTVFSEQAMKVKPYQGCYTANCGAGSPDNIFRDIVHAAAGAYLRTLTDLKAIEGIGPNRFGPDQTVTRAEAAKIITRIMALREKSLQDTMKAK